MQSSAKSTLGIFHLYERHTPIFTRVSIVLELAHQPAGRQYRHDADAFDGRGRLMGRQNKILPCRCCMRNCRRPRAKLRRVCHLHRMRKWRQNNPMKAQFFRLRDKAKSRGIEFTISFAYFEKFALRCDYVNLTGNHGHSLTVDRINNLNGYVSGNIQPMTRAKNSQKLAMADERRMRIGFRWRNG